MVKLPKPPADEDGHRPDLPRDRSAGKVNQLANGFAMTGRSKRVAKVGLAIFLDSEGDNGEGGRLGGDPRRPWM